MNKLQKKVAAAIATSAMLLQVATPAAFASTSLTISGNGDSAESEIEFEVENKTSVVQNNTAIVTNYVSANSDTGHNDANRNTGGDVKVDTGNSTTVATVSNDLNSNVADVDNCDCGGDVDVTIKGNGVDTENEVELELENKTEIWQDNVAKVFNKVDADSDTGKNDANRNTNGSVEIYTGNSAVGVGVSTSANSNYARVGGGDGNGHGSLSAWIADNGDSSENEIELEFERKTSIDQDNLAIVSNWVFADSDTGHNNANRNTGGNVKIDTGDSDVLATVDNLLNFNSADVGCDCMLGDVWAKISGNGVDSENEIEAEFESETELFQDNVCGRTPGAQTANRLRRLPRLLGGGCDTHLFADGTTGDNEAGRNTGEADGDPSIYTGDSYVDTGVWNTANSNVFGSAPDHGDDDGHDWSGMGLNLNITFDLDDLLAALLGA